VIHKQTRPRPATTIQPLLPGDPASKYDGSMFLPPPIEPTHERARAGLVKYQQGSPMSPPPAPFSPSMSKAPQSPSKYRAAPYLSMYDRLAQSNGVPINRPIAPTVKPILTPTPAPSTPDLSALVRPKGEDQHAGPHLQKSLAKPAHRGKRQHITPFYSCWSMHLLTASVGIILRRKYTEAPACSSQHSFSSRSLARTTATTATDATECPQLIVKTFIDQS
jgi:hypothetical protein